jgi:SWI/SNF-related matrix-associated actin-dependent regulator of chromatin subfamily A3
MSSKARSQAIEEFSDPTSGSPTIFLLSLKAGGVGINLTAASRVFLIDPVCLNNLVNEKTVDLYCLIYFYF